MSGEQPQALHRGPSHVCTFRELQYHTEEEAILQCVSIFLDEHQAGFCPMLVRNEGRQPHHSRNEWQSSPRMILCCSSFPSLLKKNLGQNRMCSNRGPTLNSSARKGSGDWWVLLASVYEDFWSVMWMWCQKLWEREVDDTGSGSDGCTRVGSYKENTD